MPNIVVTEPLAYAQFARLMAGAALIVTDSGGIQEEAPALGVPVLVARDSTERSEGLAAGHAGARGDGPGPSRRCGRAPMLAEPSAHRLDPAGNPYGDGRAATRMVAALEYLAGIGPAPDRFGPAFSRRRTVLEASGYPFGMFSTPLDERGSQPDRSEEHDRWVGR